MLLFAMNRRLISQSMGETKKDESTKEAEKKDKHGKKEKHKDEDGKEEKEGEEKSKDKEKKKKDKEGKGEGEDDKEDGGKEKKKKNPEDKKDPMKLKLKLEKIETKMQELNMGNSVPGIYHDIGKKARDLLYKGYIERKPTWYEYRHLSYSCGFDCTLHLKDIAPGLNTVFTLFHPDQEAGRVEFRFLHDYIGITAGIGFKPQPVLTCSTVVGTNNLSLGADFSYDTDKEELSKFNGGLSLNIAGLVASVAMENKGDTMNTTCYCVVNPRSTCAIGAELNHCFSRNETAFAFGAEYVWNQSTYMKARVNNFGKVGIVLQRQLFSKLAGALVAEIDALNLRRNPKVGFSFAVMP
ncbi:Eukaryotic porin/Tom40 [Dillenia turbinata]|uniref:Eukaryotic porin/Tom40 n=1 Tax=Dillenia turbinata TaxID=194707 RepID=A0AAN8V3N0_9MAGN